MEFIQTISILCLYFAICCVLISSEQNVGSIYNSVPTLQETERIDCCPELCDQTVCESAPKNCIYTPSEVEGVPCCYVNNDIYGYGGYIDIDGENYTEWKNQSSIFGGDIQLMKVSGVQYDHIFQFKLQDAYADRYEVPLELNLPEADSNLFDAEFIYDPVFSFSVKRAGEEDTLFDTSIGGLTFADQYLQVTTRLSGTNVYGFGEHIHQSYRHNFDTYKTWPILARDEPPKHSQYFCEFGKALNGKQETDLFKKPDTNLYSAHPFYMVIEEDGKSHGVLLWSSNALEVVFLPAPAISLRSIGGVMDIFIIIGDSPEEVVQRYHQMIGTPYFPPYWSLGFQISRYGYETLDNLVAAVDRTTEANIPLDVIYMDIDSFEEYKSFTWDRERFAGLPEYLNQIHERQIKNILILDPFMISNETNYPAYESGLEMDVFVKWPQGQSPDYDFYGDDNLLGWAWPIGRVVFPDYFHVNSTEYWEKLIVDYHLEIPFDGLWLDMNEPANFGTNEDKPWNWPEDPDEPLWSLKCPNDTQWDNPPYTPRSLPSPEGNPFLSDKTICMTALQKEGELRHYDVHNLYGHTQTVPTLSGLRKALPGQRGMVITRSTFPGTGAYGGRWLGDNASIWPHMKESIIGMLEFNMFGVPYVGADICGYFDNSTEELCQRWHQLGAFYPFSRNHNGRGYLEQDPGMYSPEMQESTRNVINIRYKLLPYLYTLFYQVHIQGGTVVRPLFHEFPTDNVALRIDEQFLWGGALMVSPVLFEGELQRLVYFPSTRWFDYRTGEEVLETGTTYIVDAPLDYIPLHVRGGYIIPLQEPGNTTYYSRLNLFHLLVAPDESNTARGDLFWDDGESVDTVTNDAFCFCTFSFDTDEITMSVIQLGSIDLDSLTMDVITVFGVDEEPSDINIPGATFSYNADVKVLTIEDLQLNMNEDFSVSWT